MVAVVKHLYRRVTWDKIVAGVVFSIIATPLLWSLGLTPGRALLAMIVIFIADRCGDIAGELAKAVRYVRDRRIH